MKLMYWTGTFPLRLWSRNQWDSHTHWPCRHKAKQEKSIAGIEVLRILNRATPRLPLKISMTYTGPKKLDNDNLSGAFKHVRDATATVLNVDDGDERVEWVPPTQTWGKKYHVRIEIEEVA